MIVVTSSFSKSSVFKMFSSHSFGLKIVFTTDLVRFQISPELCGRGLSNGILGELFFKAANEQEIILKN